MDGTAEWAMSHKLDSSRGAGTTPKLRFDHKLSVKYAKDQRVSVVALSLSPSNKRKMIKESSRAMPIHRARAAAASSSASQPVYGVLRRSTIYDLRSAKCSVDSVFGKRILHG